jgi:hypothetical protein
MQNNDHIARKRGSLMRRFMLSATLAAAAGPAIPGCNNNTVTLQNQSGQEVTIVLRTVASKHLWEFSLRASECAQISFKVRQEDGIDATIQGVRSGFGYYMSGFGHGQQETYSIETDFKTKRTSSMSGSCRRVISRKLD